MGADGQVYRGCNIENVSYGLTVCGERNAIFNMVVHGCKTFTALAVVTSGKGDAAPCGACRQVMANSARIWTRRCTSAAETGRSWRPPWAGSCPTPS